MVSSAEEKYVTTGDGVRLRYVELGEGQPLLLMHTLRTQLDFFQRLAPLLARNYKLILLDLPGHGYSDIDPGASYDEPYFRQWTIELPFLLKRVLNGGFASGKFEPTVLFRELVHTGNRKGYRRAEYQLHAHWRSWIEARKLYKRIACPVTLVYGEADWSFPEERLAGGGLLNPVYYEELAHTGHFSSLENPKAIASIFNKKEEP